MIGCVGTVLKAQNTEDKKQKGELMFMHKSLGLLSAMVVAPRVLNRVINFNKFKLSEIPHTSSLEGLAASVTHYGLYGFMIIMPVTGVAMGVYGGKGLPFFYTTFKPDIEKNGAIAKQSFGIHKQVGTYGKFLVPLHVGGALQHFFRGHPIFSRINPFGSAGPRM